MLQKQIPRVYLFQMYQGGVGVYSGSGEGLLPNYPLPSLRSLSRFDTHPRWLHTRGHTRGHTTSKLWVFRLADCERVTFFAQNTLSKASSLPGAQSLPVKRLVCELDISSSNIVGDLTGQLLFFMGWKGIYEKNAGTRL